MYFSVVAVGNFSEETGYPSSVTTPLSVGPYGQPKYMEVDVPPRHDLAPGEGKNIQYRVPVNLCRCHCQAYAVDFTYTFFK